MEMRRGRFCAVRLETKRGRGRVLLEFRARNVDGFWDIECLFLLDEWPAMMMFGMLFFWTV
jgi:hypothetical protein